MLQLGGFMDIVQTWFARGSERLQDVSLKKGMD